MKTLQKLLNYITLGSYGLFLSLLLITIVNIAIKFAPINLAEWRQQLFYFSAIILSYVIYEKTYKYLIQ